MNTGLLHIARNNEAQTFTMPGYFSNIYPSIRKCFNSAFIPFFFKHTPEGLPTAFPVTGFDLIPVDIIGREILRGEDIELPEDLINASISGGDWIIHYLANIAIPEIEIENGTYQMKITVNGVIYYSEPFLCCFNTVTEADTGDFNDDFNNDFLN